jgi:hypothetical protein
MRFVRSSLFVGAVLLLSGCNILGPYRTTTGGSGVAPANTPPPTKEALISYLNDNASRIQSIDCRDLHIDVSSGLQSAGVSGKLVCEKPRNFRLGAFAMGAQEVDMGSNDKEFWYWIHRAEPPYLVHCNYDDLNNGKARMPFPFQPEWIMEAFGMAQYGAADKYELRTPQNNTLELVETTRSPQGQVIYKVTVFSRTRAEGNQPQVLAHILEDSNGKEIVSATTTEVQQDPNTGAILPRKVKLTCPSEKLTLRMQLDKIAVNDPKLAERETVLFTRPMMPGVKGFDLARGLDAPDNGNVRRTGLFQR